MAIHRSKHHLINNTHRQLALRLKADISPQTSNTADRPRINSPVDISRNITSVVVMALIEVTIRLNNPTAAPRSATGVYR